MNREQVLQDVLGEQLRRDEPMARHTTLKVGGPARWFWAASDVEQLVRALAACTEHDIPYLFVGHGSNLLMSDKGYDGLVIQNRCKKTEIGEDTEAESGVSFGSLFLQTARAGFSGLEWAIGIPGTVGGALVSNAGAYRGNIGPLVTQVRVFADGHDQTVGPEWMEFSYRDSRLRRSGIGRTVILSCRLHFSERGDPEAATPTTRLAVEMSPSFAPSTAARNQPMWDVRCFSVCRIGLVITERCHFQSSIEVRSRQPGPQSG